MSQFLVYNDALDIPTTPKLKKPYLEDLLTLGVIFKGLITHRDWRVPAVLVTTIAVTAAALSAYHVSAWLSAIVLFELAALLIWFFLPFLGQYLFRVVLVTASIIPAIIISARFQGRTPNSFLFPLFALIWVVWLLSPLFLKGWVWRIVFWVGMLAFAAYIVCGPGAV